MPRTCEQEWNLQNIYKVINKRVSTLLAQRKLSIILPPKTILFSCEDQIRQDLFYENMENLRTKGLHIIENPIKCYEDDGGLHPTKEQTVELCKHIHKDLTKQGLQFLLPSASDDVIGSHQLYSKVNSLYKYGCCACEGKKKNKYNRS